VVRRANGKLSGSIREMESKVVVNPVRHQNHVGATAVVAASRSEHGQRHPPVSVALSLSPFSGGRFLVVGGVRRPVVILTRDGETTADARLNRRYGLRKAYACKPKGVRNADYA
jgi:hypothetical protein